MKKSISFILAMSVIITGLLLLQGPRQKVSDPAASSSAQNAKTTSSLPARKPLLQAGMSLPAAIQVEAEAMDHLQAQPALQEQELAQIAQNLKASDGPILVGLALDTKKTHSERFLAAYLLGQRSADFLKELVQIAASKNSLLAEQPAPHTAALKNKVFEVSLRVEALKGMDRENARRGAELAAAFKDIQSQSQNITVQRLARIGEVGAMNNMPLVEKYQEAKLQAVVK